LPGPFGIGDLGPAAFAWVDVLVEAKQSWWQILPLGPTGFGDSPYQSFSAFAGNPYLVSPQLLLEDGLIDAAELGSPRFPDDRVDFGPVIQFKNRMLSLAWEHFQRGRGAALKPAFEKFVAVEANWLDDFALFMAVKDAQQNRPWQEWPAAARMRQPEFFKKARMELAKSIGVHQFRQFLFFRQWRSLKTYANDHGIKIIGDVPIFVSGDSAEAWSNPHLFLLDKERRPTYVAGVPPDYFSATGQLWGNPLYDWAASERTGFAWWIARLQATLRLVDVVRLDHFRGFEAYWEIPAGSPNAIKGRWVKAPGHALLETLRKALGGLPIIAEDLGVITPEVEAMRRAFDLPSMRVLQFAFGETPDNRFLPHNLEANTVIYTGTHDNDTTWGWYRSVGERERDHFRRYLARDGSDVAWDLLRAAWSSVSSIAIVPVQDILNLGSEARMNFPGKPNGNWTWRLQSNQLNPWTLGRLAEMTELYGRGKIKADE
jgi:4-alpha-glucanotransferase